MPVRCQMALVASKPELRLVLAYSLSDKDKKQQITTDVRRDVLLGLQRMSGANTLSAG